MQVNSRERAHQIVVLCGGDSPERDVSIRSGENVVRALVQMGIRHTVLDPKNPSWQSDLLAINPCYVFIALHGASGENGAVQGFLDTQGFAYSGSGVLGSALAMDKGRAKHIWRSHDLPTLPFFKVEDMSVQTQERIQRAFSAPYCLKIVDGGSSIGVKKVDTPADLVASFHALQACNTDIIVEPWLEGGREFTVGMMHGQALPVIEIVVADNFYDYEAKYHRHDTQYCCPCDLPQVEQDYLRDTALEAFHVLGCSHWGRVDFLRDVSGAYYLLEANTIPGMTEKSLVPMAAKQIGYDFNAFILKLLPEYIQAHCLEDNVAKS